MMKKKNRSSHTHLMGPNSPSSSPAPERSRPSTLFRLLLDAQAPQAADRQEPPDSSLSRTNRDAPASSSLADRLLKQKIQSRPLSQGFTLSLSLSLKLINSETSYLCEAHSDYWNIGHGYRLVSLQDNEDGGGLVVNLLLKKGTSAYGPDIPRLRLFVKHETRNRLRVHITDAEYERWEVPYNLLPREEPPPLASSNQKTSSFHFTASEYSGEELIFSYISDPFGFAGKRRYTRDTLFNSTAEAQDPYGPMVFKDQYLEISTRLPKSGSLYGLGENTQPGGIRLQPNDPYTLYTTNISAINLNTDLYGSHPVYMDLRNGNAETAAHGVLLLNINGMNVFYRGSSLTYKIIGGVFDFFYLLGPMPLNVIDQYTSLIGRPAPMPYWALAPPLLCFIFRESGWWRPRLLMHKVYGFHLIMCHNFHVNMTCEGPKKTHEPAYAWDSAKDPYLVENYMLL